MAHYLSTAKLTETFFTCSSYELNRDVGKEREREKLETLFYKDL